MDKATLRTGIPEGKDAQLCQILPEEEVKLKHGNN